MIFFGTKGGTRTTGVHHALVIGKAPEALHQRLEARVDGRPLRVEAAPSRGAVDPRSHEHAGVERVAHPQSAAPLREPHR